jgi:hypothetical protein
MKYVLVLLSLVLVTMVSCTKEDNPGSTPTYLVKYNIGCTDCMVVYVADTAGTQVTELNKNSSWSYSFNGKQGQEVLLLAYNTGSAPQGVNVKISVNDSIYKDRTTFCAISGVSFTADTLR